MAGFLHVGSIELGNADRTDEGFDKGAVGFAEPLDLSLSIIEFGMEFLVFLLAIVMIDRIDGCWRSGQGVRNRLSMDGLLRCGREYAWRCLFWRERHDCTRIRTHVDLRSQSSPWSRVPNLFWSGGVDKVREHWVMLVLVSEHGVGLQEMLLLHLGRDVVDLLLDNWVER